jgi:superfamily II DNA/RNA helicase
MQRYMFMPARIKDCHLVYLLRTFLSEPTPAPPALPEQIIVFTSTCNAAQLLAETLRLLDVPSAPLHSRIAQVLTSRSPLHRNTCTGHRLLLSMSAHTYASALVWWIQNQRNQSLRRFKGRAVRVLVATDVASR